MEGKTPKYQIGYEIIRSNRKTVTIIVRENGQTEVRIPLRYPLAHAQQLVREKENWIAAKRRQMLQNQERIRMLELPADQFAAAKQAAQSVIPKRVAYFAERMRVTYGMVRIKDQKTRWGSCSAKGNLNFNWRLVMAPEAVLDYVVVHELCHRHCMDHSQRFWQYVEQVMPDYREARKWLKENGMYLNKIIAAAPGRKEKDERTAYQK